MMELLLASKSPRRRQLLGELGFPVRIVDIDVDESLLEPLPAHRVAETLALRKSSAYDASLLQEGQLLVTADTVVVCGGQVLGKPRSEQEAFSMLKMLSGREHEVYTGVCVKSSSRQESFTECTTVCFKPLDDAVIHHYIDQYRPFDKAGSYGIQEWIGMVGISRIQGCYYNVMGLPLSHLYEVIVSFSSPAKN